MKLFSSELGANYESYTFAYAKYAQREAGDSLADLYAKGYLPYSAAREVNDIFYMARSARIPLSKWKMTSENRRIAKKFDGTFQKKRIPLFQFHADGMFRAFCLQYFAKRHGVHAMPMNRLKLILGCGLVTTVIEYSKDSVPAAYVLEVSDKCIGHYWFSFYDLSLTRQSLGMWLMLDSVRDAQEAMLDYYYLGTVYGGKALYKTNFEPLQWWDGASWNSNTELLRSRGRSDDARTLRLLDAWKENQTFFV